MAKSMQWVTQHAACILPKSGSWGSHLICHLFGEMHCKGLLRYLSLLNAMYLHKHQEVTPVTGFMKRAVLLLTAGLQTTG